MRVSAFPIRKSIMMYPLDHDVYGIAKPMTTAPVKQAGAPCCQRSAFPYTSSKTSISVHHESKAETADHEEHIVSLHHCSYESPSVRVPPSRSATSAGVGYGLFFTYSIQKSRASCAGKPLALVAFTHSAFTVFIFSAT